MENNLYYIIHEGEIVNHYGCKTIEEAKKKKEALEKDGEMFLIVSKLSDDDNEV